MIKSLKLNIKNAQLAEVLQKQPSQEQDLTKAKAQPSKAAADAAHVEKAKPKTSVLRKAVKDQSHIQGSPVEEEIKPKRAKIVARADKTVKAADTADVSSAANQAAPLETKELKKAVAPVESSSAPATSSIASTESVSDEKRVDVPSAATQATKEPKIDLKSLAKEFVSEKSATKSSLTTRTGPFANERREVKASSSQEATGLSSFKETPREVRSDSRPSYGTKDSRPMHTSREARAPYASREPRAPFTPRDPNTAYTPKEGQAAGRTGRDPNARDSRFALNRERRPYPDTRSSSPSSGPREFNRSRDPRFAGEARPGAPTSRPPFRAQTPGIIRESFSDRQARSTREQQEKFNQEHAAPARPRLGPTGRHFRDLVPSKGAAAENVRHSDQEKAQRAQAHAQKRKDIATGPTHTVASESDDKKTNTWARTQDKSKLAKAPVKKSSDRVRIDTTRIDEDARWRKKRPIKKNKSNEDTTIRPSLLHIRLPIAVKDLAQEMKLKSSQLISKLFLQGVAVTLNDVLDDVTTVQLLGHEFGCEITIDTSEEERIRVTNKSINEEITSAQDLDLVSRPPVVAFMGHVDHGKTSLVDYIRKTNRVAHEAGAITQHIGAFSCVASHGPLTILDTPGHEAFAAMRERGAQVTDVIVLVVAGDEGIKPQTEEAIKHARSVNATILVAINKCDKPNYNIDTVYRQLAEQDLLPEAWGGKIITVKCSAVTGEGINDLLEMIALQADVLELKANPKTRARGTVIEAELHKGLGNVATVLVQNGSLNLGDALVFNQSFGRVKTMRDEFNKAVEHAKPSQAVRITGLSSLPEAGEEFVVVDSEKEARTIAEVRAYQIREKQVQVRKKVTMEALLQQAQPDRKVLHCVLRADVQGSVEALRYELMKIKSDKVDINIVAEGIGEVSESDVQLAAASGAVIIGFHTRIEAHAEELIKRHKVKIRSFDVIYHAVDGVRELMAELLDKIAEETPRGKAEVKTIFKSSQLGKIPGCQVSEGTITRSNRIRVHRQGKVVWDGGIASLRRGKDDIREVSKGFECGIVLNGFNDVEEGDIFEAYEITYHAQSL